VVIAVIALLIALILPALSQARDTARSAIELSSISQLAKTHATYANDFKDAVIPCHINKWWIWWQVCDTDMFPADPEDPSARITNDAMRPWTWRLNSYSGQPIPGVYVTSKTDFADFKARGSAGRSVATGNMVSYTDSTYVGSVAVHPSFGMNGVFFGGDNNHCAFTGQGATHCGYTGMVPESNTTANGGIFYVTRTSKALFPSSLITWAGSRGADVMNTGYWGNGMTAANGSSVRDGFYKVLPPASIPFAGSADHQEFGSVSTQPGWTGATNAGAQSRYDPSQSPTTYGYLNARYFKTVAITRLDASATRMKIGEMRDMKLWDNFAAYNTNAATGVYTWHHR
jgi:hypothetical protein